jgi:hypothetical protein
MTGNDGLLALIRVLNEIGTPYMLVGSYSSNFYGIPRSTKDADLVLQFDARSIAEIEKRLPEGLGFDRQSTFEMVTATRKEVIFIEGSDFQIELFHLSEDEFDQARFQGREKITFCENITTWMPRMEDVIVQKLRWAKGGARSKDFDDVVAILGVQETVDFSYIAQWCEKHGTLEILARARAEAGV